MPLAVTHVLISIVIAGLYRDYVLKHREYFTLHTVFLAGFFGLLPDIDVPFRMLTGILNISTPELLGHGGITHTPLFAILFLIPGFILWKKKKQETATYFFVASIMILLHITLDYVLGGGGHGGIIWLFPLTTQGWKIGLMNNMGIDSLPHSLDAILLLAWLWHEEVKHKISDFI